MEVFFQRNFVADFIQLKLSFIPPKRKSSLFEPPFGRLRGNVRTSSVARWKAGVRLPICHNWAFFTSSYCWDVTSGNLTTWAIFEGGGSLRSPILGGRRHRPPTTVKWQKTTRITLSCAMWQTDRITTPRPRYHTGSRGNKTDWLIDRLTIVAKTAQHSVKSEYKWPWRSFSHWSLFNWDFFVQLSSSWQDFNRHSASRGPSATAEPPVFRSHSWH